MASPLEAGHIAWLQQHNVGGIMDDAIHDLLAMKPDNPIEWLSNRLAELSPLNRVETMGPDVKISEKREMMQGAYRIERSELMQEYFGIMSLPYQDGKSDSSIIKGGEKDFMFSEVNEQDCLLVIDMQNDFVPKDGVFNPNGGRLACPEGDVIAEPIVRLMKLFHEKGATVVASKDYHPKNHCSFAGHGGHLPPHCIAGHDGSKLFAPIASCMSELRKCDVQKGKLGTDSNALVAFKGYHEGIDSFGGLKYTAADAGAREKIQGLNPLPQIKEKIEGIHPEALTGCQLFTCSGDYIDGQVDVDAPPDLLVCYGEDQDFSKKSLESLLRERNLKRMFVCGVAFDYCVLDTTCNAKALGFEEAYFIADAARPAYVPRSDFFQPPYGSGFLQDPKGVKQKILESGAKFCFVRHLLTSPAECESAGPHTAKAGPGVLGDGFPETLGPWKMHLASGALNTIETNVLPTADRNGEYRLIADSPLKHVEGIARHGVLGPLSPVNFPPQVRKRLDIPDGDMYYSFAHGLKNAAAVMTKDAKFSWCLHDPTYTFFILGGFLYFDQNKKLVAVLSLTGVGEGEQTIRFGGSRETNLSAVPDIISDRFQSTPAGTELRRRGAEKIAALANGELDCQFGGMLMTTNTGTGHVFPYIVR